VLSSGNATLKCVQTDGLFDPENDLDRVWRRKIECRAILRQVPERKRSSGGVLQTPEERYRSLRCGNIVCSCASREGDSVSDKNKDDLQRILVSIKEGSLGLQWVSRETGVPESKLRSFVGNDLLTPEPSALTDEEVKEILGWYFFGGIV